MSWQKEFSDADAAGDPDRMLAILDAAEDDIHEDGLKTAHKVCPKSAADVRATMALIVVILTKHLALFHVHRARREALEKRIAALEQRKHFEYRGIWSAEETYEPDDFVTLGGSMWHTDCQTAARPGSPDSPWQLCVKRGRSAR